MRALGTLESPPQGAFVAPTDVPFLEAALINRLAELARQPVDPGVLPPQAVVPRTGGRLHPLAAWYAMSVLPAIDALLGNGVLRATALSGRVTTLVADEALLLTGGELAASDPHLDSFWNVNSPDDYEQALRRLGLPSLK
jgi:molybdopterin-guanine dinucleotide biosynthesis protein A